MANPQNEAPASVPPAVDKPLFTPGPLTTSMTVKQAMLRDLGTRDHEFKRIISEVRDSILDVAGLGRADGYEAILMQGCGTMGIEAVLSTCVEPGGKVLVVHNGAYGRRILKMTQRLAGIEPVELACPENRRPAAAEVDRILTAQPDIHMVVIVHCETTSGILNDIASVGEVVKRKGKVYFVDSMSGFGGIEFDLRACGIDYLVSSANKCIEGVPGFSFVIARRDELEKTDGWARTLSLDLLAQLRGFEFDGQFLYTPPVHSILAFRQALAELAAEGGPAARQRRYGRMQRALVEGMRQMGFRTFLPDKLQSPIITTFYALDNPGFEYERFYDAVEQEGFVIYGGKVLNNETFRIGAIGRLFERDIRNLLAAIRRTVEPMKAGW